MRVEESEERGVIRFSVEVLPLSVNHIYKDRRQGGRYKDRRAQELLQLVGLETRGRRLEGKRFKLSLLFAFKGHKRQDSSNRIKHIEDVLVELGVIEDDSMIVEHWVRKVVGERERTEVEIRVVE
jgi:Holliday junction resolvase RusA-like endonuclease